MSRELSPRRRIWETAQRVTLGKTIPQDELMRIVVDREQRFQAVWDGSGEKDFSFYSDPDYVYLLLNSWNVRSGQDTDFLIRNRILDEPRVAIDFHGGMGLTAMRLAMAFPKATIISHAVVEQHREWCRQIAKELGLTNVVASGELVPADLLVAQETMEHFERPFEEMRSLIKTVKPGQILEGSSFSIVSPGHFSVFKDGDKSYDRKKTKRYFYNMLRDQGYKEYWMSRPSHKKPFNGRPALFDLCKK